MCRRRLYLYLQLIKLRVLIVTVKGLGVETAKNLVLAGPAVVTVHDEGLVELKDLGANFFLRDSDVGRRRGDAVVAMLRQLNEDVDIKTTRAFAKGQGTAVQWWWGGESHLALNVFGDVRHHATLWRDVTTHRCGGSLSRRLDRQGMQ